jgi:hypothetical protein
MNPKVGRGVGLVATGAENELEGELLVLVGTNVGANEGFSGADNVTGDPVNLPVGVASAWATGELEGSIFTSELGETEQTST